MTKRNLIIFTLLAVLILCALFAYAVITAKNDTSTQPLNTAPSTAPGSSDTGNAELGRSIALTRYDVQFALPTTINVTDIQTFYQTENDTQVVAIGSKALASNADTSKCSGEAVTVGAFARIIRSQEKPEQNNARQIGDYYYRVAKGSFPEDCVDTELYDKYFDGDVLNAIGTSLEERS